LTTQPSCPERAGAASQNPACLLTWGVFNVDMIGAGNTNPPSIALLGYAAAQAGLLLAAEAVLSRRLARPGLWRRVRCLNATAMTVYLWHFVPTIVIAVACYPTGVLAQPAIGTARCWELRPAWFAPLTAVLVPLVKAVRPAQRPPPWLSGGRGPSRPWSPALLLAGPAHSRRPGSACTRSHAAALGTATAGVLHRRRAGGRRDQEVSLARRDRHHLLGLILGHALTSAPWR
jgi:hypothetical protein